MPRSLPLPRSRKHISPLAASTEEVIEDDYISPLAAKEDVRTDTTPSMQQTTQTKARILPMPTKATSGRSPRVRETPIVVAQPDTAALDGLRALSRDQQARIEAQEAEIAALKKALAKAQATPAKTTQKGSTGTKKRNSKVTANDKKMLNAIHLLEGYATITHIAYAAGSIPHNIRARLSILANSFSPALVKADNGGDMNLYRLTAAGLRAISRGDESTITTQPAKSNTAHRNQLNSTVLAYSIGGEALERCIEKDLESRRNSQQYENRRKRDANAAIERDKDRILSIPEHLRSREDERLLNRKPAKMTALPEWSDLTTIVKGSAQQSHGAQVVVSERHIIRDEKSKGHTAAVMDWEGACRDFLDSTGPGASDAQLREAIGSEKKQVGRSWMFTHWDDNKKFGKKHRPDAVIVLPSTIDAQGEVRGGCKWIEIEENLKPDRSEYVRVIKQALDHPLVSEVIYLTTYREVVTAIRKAMAEVVTEMVSADYSNRSFEEKKADAANLVSSTVRLGKPIHINRVVDADGYWG